MVRISNNLVGILNLVTFLLSIPILGGGIWLSTRASTDCEKFLEKPIIALGAGKVVSERGYKEYKLGDYSNWLQNRVNDNKNWRKIRSCLQDSNVCKSLAEDVNEDFQTYIKKSLSPLQSGCCKPPTECNLSYVNATVWDPPATPINSTNTDCTTWSNQYLCFECQSCKAGVLDNLKRDWKKVAVINVIFLIFLIIVYSIGCCAFRNNREDNAYPRWKGNP
ncbi:Tetraspanin-8 [Thalictrum thalictroides]|uniref:Tetraspanin-8 n=1 Tax=Thalictrum thalictroides TaxID=46969 RepID=A0A7J6W0D1_THATH|nr:Tetraspanin-8 [Thalictrum thalictroides]